MLNRCILIGRLTKEPELKYTTNNLAVCRFPIAVDRGYKSADGTRATNFFDVVVWRQQGENCANYLSKGKLVAIDGRLETRTFDSQSGKRKVYEIIADNVRFLSPREEKEVKPDKGYDLPPLSDDGELPF